MKKWRRSWMIATAMLLAGLTMADTIRLKNGTAITADNVDVRGDVVEYTVGATKYTVPMSAVAKIERGGSFGVTVSTAKPGWVAWSTAPPPASPAPEVAARVRPSLPASAESAAMRERILNLGRVDSVAIDKIESEGNKQKSTLANFEAARIELDQNNVDAAAAYLRRAISFSPDSAPLLSWYVSALLQQGKAAEAAVQAERAVELEPNSPEAQQLAGFANYQAGNLPRAIAALKRAQQLKPSDAVATLLARAERENKVEDGFNELDSPHFTLRYQGRQAGVALRADLLRALENAYTELSRELGFAPQAQITTILYTEKEFFDVTEAPSWAGGLNDGKLRIPVKDMSSVTPQLERVLRHELTHSFIHSLTRGACPRWLDEGIAQMMEPRSTAPFGRELGRLLQEGHAAPFRTLEGPFTQFTAAQAQVAYAQSLAAVEYLRGKYGFAELRRLLDRIADGETGEAALRMTTHNGYEQFARDLGAFLSGDAAAHAGK